MAEPLGEGQDHVAHLVGENLVVRFASGDHAPEQVAREAQVLGLVAELTDLVVPRPAVVDPERGCIAYERVPGTPLIELGLDTRARAAEPVARVLGDLLAALHAVDHERVRDLVERDDDPLDGWLEEAAGHYDTVKPQVPGGHRPAVEAFLAAPPPARGDDLVFSHNDLGIEHVLVDPASLAVTGVIDWSDAALCDPAYDFALIFRDLGKDALAAALAAYGSEPEGVVARARFYAACALLEDLAYGIANARDEYVTKSIAALPWVLPAH